MEITLKIASSTYLQLGFNYKGADQFQLIKPISLLRHRLFTFFYFNTEQNYKSIFLSIFILSYSSKSRDFFHFLFFLEIFIFKFFTIFPIFYPIFRNFNFLDFLSNFNFLDFFQFFIKFLGFFQFLIKFLGFFQICIQQLELNNLNVGNPYLDFKNKND